MYDLATMQKIMDRDPLLEYEKRTGNSYKDPEHTREALGDFLMHNVLKEAALRGNGDSYYRMPFGVLIDLYQDLGFSVVLEDDFDGRHEDETFMVLWHPDGVLASAESYWGDRVNTTYIHFNLMFDQTHKNAWPTGASGHFHTSSWDAGIRVYVGDQDAREGLRHTLHRHREAGEYLPQWVERPWLHILTYMESHGVGERYDDWRDKSKFRNELQEARINRLPGHVIEAITPEQ